MQGVGNKPVDPKAKHQKNKGGGDNHKQRGLYVPKGKQKDACKYGKCNDDSEDFACHGNFLSVVVQVALLLAEVFFVKCQQGNAAIPLHALDHVLMEDTPQ